jgi:hypothetical protein
MTTSLPNIGRRCGGARGLLLALTGLLAVPAAAQTQQAVSTEKPMFEGPRIRVVEMEKEFGTVTRGEVLEAKYSIENVGSEPLRILRVKPG